MQTIINGVKLLKHGVRKDGKYYPVKYDRCINVHGAKMLTIYASRTLIGLPDALGVQNGTDDQVDYFEKDRARFYEGSMEYDILSAFMAAELGR